MKQGINRKILIFMSESARAKRLQGILARHGFSEVILQSRHELLERISDNVGALVLSKQDWGEKEYPPLLAILKLQPAWSQIPIVLLLPDDTEVSSHDPLVRKLNRFSNVSQISSSIKEGALTALLESILTYRALQYEMRKLLDELEKSRAEAVEASRAKTDFLANISHEIRTPLGALMGFAELIMEPGVAERERQVYMTAARRNGQLLSALIDDILDLAKVESGRIEIAKVEFSLNELIAEVINALEPQASKKNLPLVVECENLESDLMVGDPIRIRQILFNMVGNAVKFTSHGSVILRVKFEDSAGISALRMEVEDTGIGISAAQVARLFKPFTQADTSVTRRFGGTGLGLVLSQKLARAMGGDLFLKWSVPGGGSNFSICIPVHLARKNKKESESKVPSNQLPLAGSHILLVDDSLDNQLLIGQILKILGAEVELANDGQEGVEKALAGDFDVVLMDLQMPRLGGVEATRMLRGLGYGRPIVALTAHSMQEDRQKCMNVGCSDYLIKPIERAHLIEVIERFSQRHHPPASALPH